MRESRRAKQITSIFLTATRAAISLICQEALFGESKGGRESGIDYTKYEMTKPP